MENKYRDLHELPVTLRVEDLRPILGIGRNTAYELIRSGQIRSVRIGRQTGSSTSPVLKAPKTESSVRKVFLPQRRKIGSRGQKKCWTAIIRTLAL